MIRLAIILAFIGACFAQENFYVAGINGLAQTSPKPNLFVASAIWISKPQKIISYTETDATVVKQVVQTSVRSGAAAEFRCVGEYCVWLFGNAGIATNGTNTGGAGAFGGFLKGPFSARAKNLFWVVAARYIVTSIGSSQRLISLGIGFQH